MENIFEELESLKSKVSEMKKYENTLYLILYVINDGVWDWDVNSGHVSRSPGWYRMLGYDIDSLPEDLFTWQNVLHPDDYERVIQNFDEFLSNAFLNKEINEYRNEYRFKTSSGDYIWIEDRGRVVEWNPDETVKRMIGTHRNINEQKIAQQELEKKNQELLLLNQQLEEIVSTRTMELSESNKNLALKIKEIEHLAQIDSLTKIYNRNYFDVILNKKIKNSNINNEVFSLIFIDIDFFKKINDTYGHHKGDSILIRLTEQIQKVIRKSDIFARWGGEEFVILLPGTPLSGSKKVAVDLRYLIETTPLEGIYITCSFGVTSYRLNESDIEFCKRADYALYKAKNNGRNSVEVVP